VPRAAAEGRSPHGLHADTHRQPRPARAAGDASKPVIAQVHGHCLAGGSELATGCDLVYVAEDARIGYPAVRFGTPDMQYHAWLMGMRQALRVGTELSIVNSGSEGGREFINNIRELGLTEALNIRDASFQDGRTITTRAHD
jgi:enoyl-CoA hydratase/carnithine racemase